MATAITPLANLTLTAAQASVTFSSITGVYRDLMLVITGTSSTASRNLQLRLNGDTASNYASVWVYGTGSAAGSSQAALAYATIGTSAFSDTTISSHTIHIMDYSATDKSKSILGRTGVTDNRVSLSASRWANASAVTSLVVFLPSANFQIGSTFALYGVSA